MLGERIQFLRMATVGLWVGARAWCAGAEPANSPAAGILGRATDGERTVEFIAPTPNVHLRGQQSIHPQLKPQFRVEWEGRILLERAGKYSFFSSGRLFVDDRPVSNAA